MGRIEKKICELENYKTIRQYLPDDHSRRQSPELFIQQAGSQFAGAPRILDLGCGEGSSIDLFRKEIPTAIWHGVDIEDSPEVRKRMQKRDSVLTFDGVNLPYANQYFDLIYCNQVLEHVRYPDALIADVLRVLKPNGVFAGSVSYLEPYHSYSIYNFTPYGVIRVFSDAGFAIKEIRPGMDASLLINRLIFNRARIARFLWNKNYLHILFDLLGSISKLGHRERNFLKVQFAGHLFFLATRPPKP